MAVFAGSDGGQEAELHGPLARGDAAYVFFVAIVGIAVAAVNIFTTSDNLRGAGQPVALWEPVVWEASSLIMLIALTPVVMALTRVAPPLEASWWRVASRHVPGALAFSAAHVAGMGLLRWIAYSAVDAVYRPFELVEAFPYELRKDLLTYATLVAVYVAWLRLRATTAASSAEELAAIEVRDGARRRFVPLAEVAWIEAAGNYVELHRGQTPILHRAPLSQLERELQGRGFVRIHRSRLVRRDLITEVESKPSGDFVVRLADGRELAGSRRYRRPLLER